MDRPTDLSDVSDDDLLKAYKFCEEGVAAIHAKGVSYSDIAVKIGVGESAVKQFVRRGRTAEAMAVRRGSAFAAIYRFLVEKETHIIEPLFESLLKILAEFREHDPSYERGAVYALILTMLHVSRADQEGAADRVYKRLYAIRCAAMEGYLVKSELTFFPINMGAGIPIWEFKHYFRDDNGVEKKSDGMAVAINKSIYLLGDIQSMSGGVPKSEGLDIFVIRKPIDRAEVMAGFHVSIDDDRPLFANSVFFDADSFDAQAKKVGVVDRGEKTGVLSKAYVEKAGILGDVESGKALSDQLAINATEGVLRIKLRHLINVKSSTL